MSQPKAAATKPALHLRPNPHSGYAPSLYGRLVGADNSAADLAAQRIAGTPMLGAPLQVLGGLARFANAPGQFRHAQPVEQHQSAAGAGLRALGQAGLGAASLYGTTVLPELLAARPAETVFGIGVGNAVGNGLSHAGEAPGTSPEKAARPQRLRPPRSSLLG